MSVAFVDRKNSQCAYLVDHMVCCGEPVTRNPYCARHNKICRYRYIQKPKTKPSYQEGD
jgi:hypothetical protein